MKTTDVESNICVIISCNVPFSRRDMGVCARCCCFNILWRWVWWWCRSQWDATVSWTPQAVTEVVETCNPLGPDGLSFKLWEKDSKIWKIFKQSRTFCVDSVGEVNLIHAGSRRIFSQRPNPGLLWLFRLPLSFTRTASFNSSDSCSGPLNVAWELLVNEEKTVKVSLSCFPYWKPFRRAFCDDSPVSGQDFAKVSRLPGTAPSI